MSYDVNPVAEFQKVLGLMTDEPAATPAPALAPATPKPAASKPLSPGETKLAIARDLMRHRLALAEKMESDGKPPGKIADAIIGVFRPSDPLPPTERELELAEQAAQARPAPQRQPKPTELTQLIEQAAQAVATQARPASGRRFNSYDRDGNATGTYEIGPETYAEMVRNGATSSLRSTQ